MRTLNNSLKFKQSSSCDCFIPEDLDSRDQEKQSVATEIVWSFFKDAVKFFNSNLIRNANNMMSTLPHASNMLPGLVLHKTVQTSLSLAINF